MEKTKFLKPLFLISFILVMIAGTLSADVIVIENPLAEGTQFEDIIDNLIDFIFNIAIVLAPLMVVIAGFLFVTAGGNLEQTQRARNIILWTIIGFLIILFAKGIMAVIENLLGVN
ncbi:MAG: hypothetical protein ACKKMW_00870 [Candidatus Nealsonbacteria bacterium]